MEFILLRTEKLQLRSATAELSAEFFRLFEADVPRHWPPPLNDDNTKAFTANYLKKNPDAAGWGTRYFLLPGRAEERPRAVGVGGFKGKPSWEGTAEIGYSVMPDYQRLGFALEAVAGLVGWAFPTRRGLVTAETLPALEVSIRVLENNGFHYFEEAPKKASSDTGSTETSLNPLLEHKGHKPLCASHVLIVPRAQVGQQCPLFDTHSVDVA